jgi:hypothetical protein
MGSPNSEKAEGMRSIRGSKAFGGREEKNRGES